eukprot:130062-Rhodomonas_salina.1
MPARAAHSGPRGVSVAVSGCVCLCGWGCVSVCFEGTPDEGSAPGCELLRERGGERGRGGEGCLLYTSPSPRDRG